MDLNIIKEKEVPLLDRKRVVLEYTSQEGKTPSRAQIIKDVAKKIGATQDTIAIRHIYTKFGSTTAKIIAHVYKNKATMEKYEDKKLLAKQAPKQEKKEGAEASE